MKRQALHALLACLLTASLGAGSASVLQEAVCAAQECDVASALQLQKHAAAESHAASALQLQKHAAASQQHSEGSQAEGAQAKARQLHAVGPHAVPPALQQSSEEAAADALGAAQVEVTGFKEWTFYQYSLVPMIMLAAVVAFYTMPQADDQLSEEFKTHRWTFNLVWAIAVAADWLQGPYVYALYASYGYSDTDISGLFVAGFGASLVFGMFAGATADAFGRKRCAIVYCILYIVSCMTKHSSWYPMLFAGRITGGVATSLLFTTFECWMIAEHRRHDYGHALLRYMFSLMYLVNYLVATSMGLLAQGAVGLYPLTKVSGLGFETVHYGGDLAAFDLAIVALLIALPLICVLWDENYGDEEHHKVLDSFVAAVGALGSSWRLCMLGAMIAGFEGCMYFFVLKWTPALTAGNTPCPHGLVFAVFMMACMCGSSFFSFFDPDLHPTRALLPVFFVSATIFVGISKCVGNPGLVHMVYFAFVVFEACVGVYFPSIGALKSQLVPERARAGVYNAYRVPLNIVVIAITMTQASPQVAFMAGALLMLVAFLGVASIAAFWEEEPRSSKKEALAIRAIRACQTGDREEVAQASAGAGGQSDLADR